MLRFNNLFALLTVCACCGSCQNSQRQFVPRTIENEPIKRQTIVHIPIHLVNSQSVFFEKKINPFQRNITIRKPTLVIEPGDYVFFVETGSNSYVKNDQLRGGQGGSARIEIPLTCQMGVTYQLKSVKVMEGFSDYKFIPVSQ